MFFQQRNSTDTRAEIHVERAWEGEFCGLVTLPGGVNMGWSYLRPQKKLIIEWGEGEQWLHRVPEAQRAIVAALEKLIPTLPDAA